MNALSPSIWYLIAIGLGLIAATAGALLLGDVVRKAAKRRPQGRPGSNDRQSGPPDIERIP